MGRLSLFTGPTADMSEDEKMKLLRMKKKKKDFDFMTCSVLKEQQKHLLASLHFKAVYNDLCFIPSIFITLATGVLAVLSQSDLFTEHSQSIFTLTISALAAFSVFWQSLIKQLDFGGRALLHESTAGALTKLYNTSDIKSKEQRITKLDNDINAPKDQKIPQQTRGISAVQMEEGNTGANQDSGGNTPDEDKNDGTKPSGAHLAESEDHSALSKQFEQATSGCTSLVPIQIASAYNSLESRVTVSNRKLILMGTAKPKVAWEKVYPALYDQLKLTIIGYRWWPYKVPDAEWAVNKTIKDFQNMDCDLLKALVDQTELIDKHYDRLVTSERTPLVPTSSSRGIEQTKSTGGHFVRLVSSETTPPLSTSSSSGIEIKKNDKDTTNNL
mmetsp:Transcript_19396/g.42184  ORF Transcript_19396/g.42184 Transcript_19396/m.42184 type:complete len:386 (-) Transcript_19396:144-1301(-)